MTSAASCSSAPRLTRDVSVKIADLRPSLARHFAVTIHNGNAGVSRRASAADELNVRRFPITVHMLRHGDAVVVISEGRKGRPLAVSPRRQRAEPQRAVSPHAHAGPVNVSHSEISKPTRDAPRMSSIAPRSGSGPTIESIARCATCPRSVRKGFRLPRRRPGFCWLRRSADRRA